MKNNALLLTDSYKLGHAEQYPSGTTLVVSNFTPRSLKHSTIQSIRPNHKIVVHGIHAAIKTLTDMWKTGFFDRNKEEVINEFMTYTESFRPHNFDKTRFERLHDLQYLPISVKSLPEGTQVQVKIPVFTIHNTIDEFFWITNYLETSLSALIWKPMTVATIAKTYRDIISEYSTKTGAAEWFTDFQCHDFSSRGLSNIQDIEQTGCAHLLSFMGTDSLPALRYVTEHYNLSGTDCIGASVPATEHSVMCMGTKTDELETFKRLISETYPTGIVSIVSDTWDYFKVLTEVAPLLKDMIMSRDGKVVFRPDSGNPIDIICGSAIPVPNRSDMDVYSQQIYYVKNTDEYIRPVIEIHKGAKFFKYLEVIRHPTPEMKGSIKILHELFGGTTTSKGYITIDGHVGLIYGDSITLERCDEILNRLEIMGFASDNIVFGVGSYSYQHLTRDTFGFAMKATYGEVNGEPREIFKDPKTDSGIKKSLKGLVFVNENLEVSDQCTMEKFLSTNNMLKEIYNDGVFRTDKPVFSDIKALLK